MKRIISLVLCLVLAFSLLAACSAGDEKKAEETTAEAENEKAPDESKKEEETTAPEPETTEAPETEDPYPDPDTGLPLEEQIREYLSKYVLLQNTGKPVLYCFGDDMTVYTYGNDPTADDFMKLTPCASWYISNDQVTVSWWRSGTQTVLSYITNTDETVDKTADAPLWKKLSALPGDEHFLYEAGFDPSVSPSAQYFTTYSTKENVGIK